jgi:hypothetical protein
MKWVESPLFPPDCINHISNREAFMVCTRDIEIGEYMRWKYPYAHHMSPISKPKPPKHRATISSTKKADALAHQAAAVAELDFTEGRPTLGPALGS